jgi:hypothetical protein
MISNRYESESLTEVMVFGTGYCVMSFRDVYELLQVKYQRTSLRSGDQAFLKY